MRTIERFFSVKNPLLQIFLSNRPLWLAQVAICVGGLFMSFYLEFVDHVIPCPLCLLMRYLLMLSLCILIYGLFFAPKKDSRTLQIVASLVHGVGVCVAMRYWWLQNFSKNTSCFFDSNAEAQSFLSQAAHAFFSGDTPCSELVTILGTSLGSWGLMSFVVLCSLSLEEPFLKDFEGVRAKKFINCEKEKKL